MVEVEGGFFVETVNVFLQLEHSSRGHLRILLTSPSGTTSVLTPGSIPENTMETQMWKLVALKNWGESPVGAWKISLEDEKEGDVSNCEDDEFTYELVDEETGIATLGCGDFAKYCLGTDDGFDPNDPFFIGLEGTTVGEACCACGGGCKFSTCCFGSTHACLISRSSRFLLSYDTTRFGVQHPRHKIKSTMYSRNGRLPFMDTRLAMILLTIRHPQEEPQRPQRNLRPIPHRPQPRPAPLIRRILLRKSHQRRVAIPSWVQSSSGCFLP